MLTLAPHPSLDLHAFVSVYPDPMGQMTTPQDILDLLDLEASAPFAPDETIKRAVRDMLRTRRFKPTGRNKPASEYLVKAASSGRLGAINPAVDACNAVSLHSGLPISVVDLDKVDAPLRVDLGEPGTSYVFNLSGQALRLEGLLCLFDAGGPCASPIKDSQRSKVNDRTRRTLSLVWGPRALEAYTARVGAWYEKIVSSMGCRIETVEVRQT